MSGEDQIRVDLLDRIQSLTHTEIGYTDEFVYEYRAGYEIVTHNVDGGGKSEYRGVFHPNDGLCETSSGSEEGICKWCGTTLGRWG